MRCLFCGKEYWLPAQVRRDPDFCSAAHREKYKNLVERAMRCIQESAPLPAAEPMPAPVVAAPATRPPSSEIQAAGEGPAPEPAVVRPMAVPVSRAESSEPKPVAKTATPAESPLVPRPKRFRERPHIPQLTAQPVFERLQEETPTTAPSEEKSAGASLPGAQEAASRPMFSLLETSAQNGRKAGRLALTAMAACIGAGGILWIGVHAARFGRNLLNSTASQTAAAPKSVPALSPARSESASFQPSLAWFRSAAVQHAATRLSESFDSGMRAWGVRSAAWAPGWSHSPDGFVRPGQLALFQPTLGYADYRMEFLGEIENKSLSWVVRGKDARNYYAMRLTLVKPGLRPLLSLAHYAVVDGKPGRAVEVPLSVMIHNQIPYHVAVQVHGNIYTVSIEGDPADSWSDDVLPAGGVGFFSEPGARARIYCLNVYRNDNWLGWVCARIAGTAGPHQTAI